MARHLWINLPNSYTFLVPVPKGFNFHGIFWNFFARSVGSLGNNLVVLCSSHLHFIAWFEVIKDSFFTSKNKHSNYMYIVLKDSEISNLTCFNFILTGYSFWDRMRNSLHKFTWIVLSVHKLNKLGNVNSGKFIDNC